jgi:hypothetical protein
VTSRATYVAVPGTASWFCQDSCRALLCPGLAALSSSIFARDIIRSRSTGSTAALNVGEEVVLGAGFR